MLDRDNFPFTLDNCVQGADSWKSQQAMDGPGNFIVNGGAEGYFLGNCPEIRLLVIPAVFKPESSPAKNLDSGLKTAGMTKQGAC
jgi:hypothetical protein